MGNIFSYEFLFSFICLLALPTLTVASLPEGMQKAIDHTRVVESSTAIVVDASQQKLFLYKQGRIEAVYTISTAARGLGSAHGSWKTPLGLHRVKDRIGSTAPPYAIFRSRKYIGKRWQADGPQMAEEDLILSRILRLEGLEQGENCGRNHCGELVDSYDRYIYIHGTNHEKTLGTPCSQGCIRMSSSDVIELFDRVPRGTLVWITPGR